MAYIVGEETHIHVGCVEVGNADHMCACLSRRLSYLTQSLSTWGEPALLHESTISTRCRSYSHAMNSQTTTTRPRCTCGKTRRTRVGDADDSCNPGSALRSPTICRPNLQTFVPPFVVPICKRLSRHRSLRDGRVRS